MTIFLDSWFRRWNLRFSQILIYCIFLFVLVIIIICAFLDINLPFEAIEGLFDCFQFLLYYFKYYDSSFSGRHWALILSPQFSRNPNTIFVLMIERFMWEVWRIMECHKKIPRVNCLIFSCIFWMEENYLGSRMFSRFYNINFENSDMKSCTKFSIPAALL